MKTGAVASLWEAGVAIVVAIAVTAGCAGVTTGISPDSPVWPIRSPLHSPMSCEAPS